MIDDEITIEHIFPQSPDQIWRDELGEEACKNIQEQYLHTIGNLTLIGNNGTLGNKSFREKRDLKEIGYKDSRLWLNSSLGSLDRWNEEEIEKRCKELTERFLNVWLYPDIILNETEYKDEVNIFDVDDPTGKKPEYIIIMDEKIMVKSARDMYRKVIEKLFNRQPELFVEEMKDKITLQKDKENVRDAPYKISDTYYIETKFNFKTIFDRIKHALIVFGLEDKLIIKFRET